MNDRMDSQQCLVHTGGFDLGVFWCWKSMDDSARLELGADAAFSRVGRGSVGSTRSAHKMLANDAQHKLSIYAETLYITHT